MLVGKVHRFEPVFAALLQRCALSSVASKALNNPPHRFAQDAPGTMIGNFVTEPDAPAGHFVKGFATIDDVSLINVEVHT